MSIDKDTFEKKILNNLKNAIDGVQKYISDMHNKKIRLSMDQLSQLMGAITKGKMKSLYYTSHSFADLICTLSRTYMFPMESIDSIIECTLVKACVSKSARYVDYFTWFDIQMNIHKYVPTQKQVYLLVVASYKKSLKLLMELNYGIIETERLHTVIIHGSYEEQDLLDCLYIYELSIFPEAYSTITKPLCPEIITHIITRQPYSNEALKYLLVCCDYNIIPTETLHKYYDECIKLNGNDTLIVIAEILKHTNKPSAQIVDYMMAKLARKITPAEFCKIYTALLIPGKLSNISINCAAYTKSLITSTNICNFPEIDVLFSEAVFNYDHDHDTIVYLIHMMKKISEKCIGHIISKDLHALVSLIFDKKIIPHQHLIKYVRSKRMLDLLIGHGLNIDHESVSVLLKAHLPGFDIIEYGYTYDLNMYKLYCINGMFNVGKDEKMRAMLNNNFEVIIPDYGLRHQIYLNALSPDVSILEKHNIDHFMYEQMFRNYTRYEGLITACEKKYKYVPTLKLIAHIDEPETRQIIVDKIKSAYTNLPKELFM